MDCEIIKDLMPLYIENLSSESSNKLILEHIKNCENCNEMINTLKDDIEICSKEEEDDDIMPQNLIKRIKKNIFLKSVVSVLITLALGIFIGFAIFDTRTPMFIVFVCLTSICSFAAAIFISIAISKNKSTLRKRFKSVGNWTFVFSIIICPLFFVIFKFYFNETSKMVFTIVLEIIYNIIFSTTLRIYARFKLPKNDISNTKKITNRNLFIVVFSTLIVITTIFVVPVTLLEKNKIVDNIDLPFVTDASVIGRWTTVDVVENPDQFNPNNLSTSNSFVIKEMTFLEYGKLKVVFSNVNNNQMGDAPTPWLSWTKNCVINKGGDHVASKYEIREIEGSKYLFVEYKSADYFYFHISPHSYVLKYENP